MKPKFGYISVIVAMTIVLGIVAGTAVLRKNEQEISFTSFLQQVEAGHMEEAEIVRQDAYASVHGNPTRYHTIIPTDSSKALTDLLMAKGVRTILRDVPPRNWFQVILQASPFLELAFFRLGAVVGICLVIILCTRRTART